MRERRVFDGKTKIFDAVDVLDGRKHKNQVLLKMKNGPISYTTTEGVRFWNKHPFQWVEEGESVQLLQLTQPEFYIATKEQVEDYYSYDY